MPISLKNAANAAVIYNPLRSEGSKTLYIGVSHSDIAKDQLSLSTTAPKRSANSYGNRRATFNVVRTVTVGTPVVQPNPRTQNSNSTVVYLLG